MRSIGNTRLHPQGKGGPKDLLCRNHSNFPSRRHNIGIREIVWIIPTWRNLRRDGNGQVPHSDCLRSYQVLQNVLNGPGFERGLSSRHACFAEQWPRTECDGIGAQSPRKGETEVHGDLTPVPPSPQIYWGFGVSRGDYWGFGSRIPFFWNGHLGAQNALNIKANDTRKRQRVFFSSAPSGAWKCLTLTPRRGIAPGSRGEIPYPTNPLRSAIVIKLNYHHSGSLINLLRCKKTQKCSIKWYGLQVILRFRLIRTGNLVPAPADHQNC